MASANRMCFTLNNYTDDNINYISEHWGKIATYFVYGKERAPSTGTPHLQGYVEWNSSKKFVTVHKMFDGRASWTRAFASGIDNRTYCAKDGDFVEWGVLSVGQGVRSDLTRAMSLIDEGATDLELFREMPEIFFRYGRAMEKYRLLAESSQARTWIDKDVRVYWGTTGTGKTRTAMEEFPNAFRVTCGITGLWWSGYNGETEVVIDEFRGNQIPLAQLLVLLDGWQSRVSVHGNLQVLRARTIIITSNIAPTLWYENADDQSRMALNRRLKEIRYFGPPAAEV